MVRAIQSLDCRKSEVQDFPLTISKTVKLWVSSQVNDFLVIARPFRPWNRRRQVDLLAPACLPNPSRRLGRESTGLGLFVLQKGSLTRSVGWNGLNHPVLEPCASPVRELIPERPALDTGGASTAVGMQGQESLGTCVDELTRRRCRDE